MFKNLCLYLNNLFRLSFDDSDFEEKFREEYLRDSIKQNALAIKLTLLSYIMYLPLSYFVTPNEFYEDLMLMLLLPILSSVLALLFIKDIKKGHSAYLFIYSITITIPPIISLFFTSEYHNIYLGNYILVLVGVMIIYGAFFFITFFSVLIVNIIAALVIIFSDTLPLADKLYHLFFINIAFMVTTIGSYLNEKGKRNIYLDKYKQNQLSQEIISKDQEIIRKDELINHQTRMAQMGQMLSMIAHQWRQPLGAINSILWTINSKIELNKYDLNIENQRKNFISLLQNKHTKIEEQTKYLSDTIEDFSNFFKPNKAKEKKSITYPIYKSLNLIKASLINSEIEIIEDFKIDKELNIYQNELMQVILNILSNSKDNFIEKNIKSRKIIITTNKVEDSYSIKFCDNGGGIDENIIKNIFDPYFSTKDEKKGTGLGLYMSKIIVENHHNGILLAKNTENGVCFEIILHGDDI
jgi:signal transduction histidine kinase